ncbi:hypothetical protein TNCT_305451 [Trichonephila clavata]|uniref:Uncharacterized protein n=1 Tax=Trichonephila clavata TaxID=2740835 RepID=A0A8X6HZD8_TRICU|nr:hypothetical protein TNCT_305451 [Trichonephila clavata]
MATTTAPTPSQPLPGTDASKGIKKRKPGIKDVPEKMQGVCETGAAAEATVSFENRICAGSSKLYVSKVGNEPNYTRCKAKLGSYDIWIKV